MFFSIKKLIIIIFNLIGQNRVIEMENIKFRYHLLKMENNQFPSFGNTLLPKTPMAPFDYKKTVIGKNRLNRCVSSTAIDVATRLISEGIKCAVSSKSSEM